MNDASTRAPSEHYCSNSIRVALNTIVYSKSPSPWSPFARNAMEAIRPYLVNVADMTPTELRGFIQCALGEYLDSASAARLAEDIPNATLIAVLAGMGGSHPNP